MLRSLAVAVALVLLLAPPAAADDDDERYLLGQPGVRIELPADWQPVDWTDAGLEAETTDRSLKLYAWSEPGQVPLRQGDLAAWAAAQVEKLEGLGGGDVAVKAQRLAEVGGRQVVRVDLEADFGEGRRGAWSAVTLPVEGRTFHLGVFAAAQRASQAARAVEALLSEAEIRRPAQELATGGPVEGAGVRATLPEGWRAPLAAEAGVIAGMAKDFGAEDLEDCWTALRPEAHDLPDVLVTCGGGALLGVVDDHSFAGVDALLRKRLFGAIPVDPAEPLTLSDGRTGLLYRLAVPGRTLRMAVVPYGAGIARTWMYGDDPDDGERFDAELIPLVTQATYEGAHPVGLGDQLTYWWTWRRTSPVVWGPGLALVGLVGATGMRLRRRQDGELDDLD